MVEVTQRFDLPTSRNGDITIAINCIAFSLACVERNCYWGSIIIRSMDKNGEPDEILRQIDTSHTGIQPIGPDWYDYDESFRVLIPASFKKSIFVGYLTAADPSTHTVVAASGKGVNPVTPSFLWTNLTKEWEALGPFYGHLGINADIIVP